METSYPEVFHNIIVDIFDVVLKDGPVLPPHALSQIKPQLYLGFGTALRSCDCISTRIHTAYLVPNPELIHGHICFLPESLLIPIQPPSCLLTCQQDLSKYFQRWYYQDDLSVINP